MDESDVKIDIELDENINGIINITCPACQRVERRKFSELSAGTEITCLCGSPFTFNDDGLASISGALSELKRSFESFGE